MIYILDLSGWILSFLVPQTSFIYTEECSASRHMQFYILTTRGPKLDSVALSFLHRQDPIHWKLRNDFVL